MRNILADAGLPVADMQEIDGYSASLQERLFALNGEAASTQSKIEAIESFKTGSDLSTLPVDTPESRRLVAEIGAAEARLSEVRGTAGGTPEALDVIESNIDNLRERLQQEVEIAALGLAIDRRAVDAQRDAIRREIDKLNALLASDVWTEIDTIRRDRVFLESAYLDYQERLEAVRKEGQVRPPLRVVADAMTPSAPSWPNYRAVLAIAATLGLFLGIAVAAMREWLRYERLRRQSRAGTRVVSSVPR
jgi:uncharacterized protein involved in exopolysaccharide biosynthesis